MLGLFSIIAFSGCVSQKQQDIAGSNLMKDIGTSGSSIIESTNSDSEKSNGSSTTKLEDNEVKHCVCHLSEIQYDYWIAKDEIARETTMQGKVKQSITRQENCAIQAGIPKQCSALDFDFDQMKNEWIGETETMSCNCDKLVYDKKYFE